MAKEKVFIQIDDEKIELKGEELNAHLQDVNERIIKIEELFNLQQAQKELKISAYKKLGLTDEEIQAII